MKLIYVQFIAEQPKQQNPIPIVHTNAWGSHFAPQKFENNLLYQHSRFSVLAYWAKHVACSMGFALGLLLPLLFLWCGGQQKTLSKALWAKNWLIVIVKNPGLSMWMLLLQNYCCSLMWEICWRYCHACKDRVMQTDSCGFQLFNLTGWQLHLHLSATEFPFLS